MLVSDAAQWSLPKGETCLFFSQFYVQAGDSLCSKYSHNAKISRKLWSLEKLVVGGRSGQDFHEVVETSSRLE